MPTPASNGQKARLIVDGNIVKIDHPAIDYLLATTEKKDKVFVILLNNRAQATDFQISIKGAAAKARQLPALGFEILTITL